MYGVAADVTVVYEDATNRPLSVYVDKENGISRVDITSYTYNAAGKITSALDKQDSGSTDLQCYGYDNVGRLATAWSDNGSVTTSAALSVFGVGGCADTNPAASNISGPAPYWQTYSYDAPATARLRRTRTSPAAVPWTSNNTYPYPAAGAVQPHTLSSTGITGVTTGTDIFTYDTAGNTLTRKLATGANQTLGWDAEGRLASVKDNGTGKTSSYTYDSSGALLVQRDPTETVLHVAGQEIHLSSAGVKSGVRFIPVGSATVVETKSAINYEFTNLQGTASDTVNGLTLKVTRRYFDPYGKPRGAAPATWPDEHAFLDNPADAATGLDLIGARAYDNAAGRFVFPDPVFEQTRPDQMGGYTYGADDPVNNADPCGPSTPATARTTAAVSSPTSGWETRTRAIPATHRSRTGRAERRGGASPPLTPRGNRPRSTT